MPELSERKKQVLGSVIDLYIKSGEPVGSKGLILATGMTVSSATIRNEMSELSALGYLEQPHTSAGRIPSQKGYRYYVDNLMQKKDTDENTRRLIDAAISAAGGDPEKLISRARELLADITKCACISTAPTGLNYIRKVELVPVGNHTAMMILLTSNGILKSRLCYLDCSLDAKTIEKFYNISGTYFVGKPAGEITMASMQTIAASMTDDYFTMLPLLASVTDLAGSTSDSRLVLGGSSNLLGIKDYGTEVISLLKFLSKSDPLNEIISSSKDSLTVNIGTENKFRPLENSSVIVSRYKVKDDDSGTLSIIGPTRMDYETIIPNIQYLSNLVGQLITRALEE